MSSIDKATDIEHQQVHESTTTTDKTIEGFAPHPATQVPGKVYQPTSTSTSSTTKGTTSQPTTGMTSTKKAEGVATDDYRRNHGRHNLDYDLSHKLSKEDHLYILSVIFSIFANALSFGGIPYTAGETDIVDGTERIFKTYAAFAYMFLIFSFFQTALLIIGMGRPEKERHMMNGTASSITLFNIVLLIIAISTLGTAVPITADPPFRQSCLIIALGIELIVAGLQFMALKNIKSLPNGSTGYYFPPLSSTNRDVSNMLISNAILSFLSFAFALGGLIYPSVYTPNQTPIIQASVAFSILFFLTSFVCAISSVMALVPGPSIEPTIVASWIFSLLSFIFSFLTFILQAATFGGVTLIIGYFLVAWIVSLASYCIGMSAWLLMTGQSGEYFCRCDDMNSELTRQRNIVLVEKARLEAAKLRKEREHLELAQS